MLSSAALAIPAIACGLLFHDQAWSPALALALTLVAGNGLLVLLIHHKAIGSAPPRFLIWSLLGNGFRIMVLILAIYLVYQRTFLNFKVFITGALTGYFTFLFGEVWGLHRTSIKDDNER